MSLGLFAAAVAVRLVALAILGLQPQRYEYEQQALSLLAGEGYRRIQLGTPHFAQGPPLSQQAQSAAIEKILVGEDTRNADLIREAMQEGAQRRRGIRALGRLEQPDQIRYVAPALGDGVGIRAEAAWALAQLATTPEAVVQVQGLLIERAEQDAGAGLWEVWGELAAALGRLT